MKKKAKLASGTEQRRWQAFRDRRRLEFRVWGSGFMVWEHSTG